MPLTLYDPCTQTMQVVDAGQTPHPICALTQGPSEGLAALRQAVVDDLVARLLGGRSAAADEVAQHAEREAIALGGVCEPETLRYWILTVHYRAPLVLSSQSAGPAARFLELEECERRVTYLAATKQRLATLPAARIVPVQTAPSTALAELADALEHALEDDLDTPRALIATSAFLSAVNALCDAALRKQGRVNASAVDSAHVGFSAIEALLGLGAGAPSAFLRRVRDQRARRQQLDPAAVDAIVAQRTAARAAKDFAAADALQAKLLDQGITLLDGSDGTSWTFV